MMSTFGDFLEAAWNDHASDPRGVADRLGEALGRVEEDSQIPRLAMLAHHVFGEHLGEWQQGIDYVHQVSQLAALQPGGAGSEALERCRASLALSAGEDVAAPSTGLSDRIRIGVMAAANLVTRNPARALSLFGQSLSEAAASGLDGADPMNRALALNANNMAVALEKKSPRSAEERKLMLEAAQAARHYWERAGTWLEVERAEYRLAMSWLQAGDPARARRHAQDCLRIVQDNTGPPLERLFAWQALGTVDKAAGDTAARDAALAEARAAFAELDEDDKSWCAESLARLAA